MNIEAWERANKSYKELNKIVGSKVYVSENLDDYDVNLAWHRFVHLAADTRSGLSRGQLYSGTMTPSIHYSEVARLNQWRIADLKEHPDRFPYESPSA
jgi:hypothetical protein